MSSETFFYSRYESNFGIVSHESSAPPPKGSASGVKQLGPGLSIKLTVLINFPSSGVSYRRHCGNGAESSGREQFCMLRCLGMCITESR
jgi:hypothetical protein